MKPQWKNIWVKEFVSQSSEENSGIFWGFMLSAVFREFYSSRSALQFTHILWLTDNEIHPAGIERTTLVRPSELPDREHGTQTAQLHFKTGQVHFTTEYDSIFGKQGGESKENKTTYMLRKIPSCLHPFSQSLYSLCFLMEGCNHLLNHIW